MKTKRKNNPSFRALGMAAALCIATITSSPAQNASSPLYLPFQGQITDQNGTLVADGAHSVIFNLYDTAVGGQPVWSERHTKIGVTRGALNVFLGSINPLSGVDFSSAKYLGITVDVDNLASTAEPEMVPRSVIIPAFHAKTAENTTNLAGKSWSSLLTSGNDPDTGEIAANKLETNGITASQLGSNSVEADEIASGAVTTDEIADGTVTETDLSTSLNERLNLGLIPPGTIAPFAGPVANIPAGWLLCDGGAVDKDGESGKYGGLHAAIGTAWGDGSTGTGASPGVTEFNLPDLRGMFLRGVANGEADDPNRASRTASAIGGNVGDLVGSAQGDAFQGHYHQSYGNNWGTSGIGGGEISNQNTAASRTLASPAAREATSDGTNGTPRVSSETRPKNAYVNYIIKY